MIWASLPGCSTATLLCPEATVGTGKVYWTRVVTGWYSKITRLNSSCGKYAGLTYPRKEDKLFSLVRGQYRGEKSLTDVLKGRKSCLGHQQKHSQWRDLIGCLKWFCKAITRNSWGLHFLIYSEQIQLVGRWTTGNPLCSFSYLLHLWLSEIGIVTANCTFQNSVLSREFVQWGFWFSDWWTLPFSSADI